MKKFIQDKKETLNNLLFKASLALTVILPFKAFGNFGQAVADKITEGREEVIWVVKSLCGLAVVICLGKIVWDKFNGGQPNWGVLVSLMLVAFAVSLVPQILGFFGIM